MPLTRRSAALLLEAQAGEATKEPPPQSLGAPPLALSDLGDDLLSSILSHLPPEDLLAAALVSREWRKLTSADSIWRPHCEASWQGRLYCPAAGRRDLPCKQRFLYSQADARRTKITRDELCAFRWRFHFKQQAGEFWMAMDPFYTGEGEPMQRLFSKDGSLSAPPGDPLWGHHENRWRFCKTKEGRRGHFVKVNHWPSLTIHRGEDGGWMMQNEWVVYEAILEPGGPYSAGVRGKEAWLR